MDKLARPIYKDILTEWKDSESVNGEKREEKCRACNISVRPSTLERIDLLWESGYVDYDSRSEFLRDIILERVSEIEELNDLSKESDRI